MPWTAKDAPKHTKAAKTPVARRQWAHVADAVLKKTGDDAQAVRAANAVVKRRRKK